ncbi:MAG: molybdopterin dinucleotide binding domain-containing protein [Gemmataceae bacterium]
MSDSTIYILIPGRTARQGTSLNEGKFTNEYIDETTTVLMNTDDMAKHGLSSGDKVRLRSDQGEVVLACKPGKKDELPSGILFLPYGDASSRLMSGDTHGTGMPNSKGIDVELEKVESDETNTSEFSH